MIRIRRGWEKLGVLACFLASAGCNDETKSTTRVEIPSASASSSQRLASCDRITGMSTCSEYGEHQLATDEKFLTATCGKLGGTFVSAECPNTSIVGSCTLATGETRRLYSSGAAAYDAARAKKECESVYSGKWTSR